MDSNLIISFDPMEFYCRTRGLTAIERACFIDIIIKTSSIKIDCVNLFESLNEYSDEVIIKVMDTMCIEINGYIKSKINTNVLPIGAGHYAWKGGQKNNYRIRNSKKMIEFKKHCLKRDNYKCIKCGKTEQLHVHHIKEFSKFPQYRFDIDNGITLCKDCHQKEHKFNLYNQWH